jgi:uncharacterized protein
MKKIIFYLLLMQIFFHGVLSSQSQYGPWDQDVSVGDKNIAGINVNVDKNIKTFGGPQAGAHFLIRFFQLFISPQDGPNCRFRPTCSSYGQLAVLKYGALAGSFLAGDRLLRCNPYNESGEDPVPAFVFRQTDSIPGNK